MKKFSRPVVAWCECCEQAIYPGEMVLCDNRFKTVQAYICMACFAKANKVLLAEMLGGSFEETV